MTSDLPSNPLIADLFRRIDMVESWGRGMTLIHQNAPAVTFREVGQLFIASFARPSFSLKDQETVEKTVDVGLGHAENTSKTTGTTTSTTTGSATGKAVLLLEHLRAHPQTTIPDMAQVLDMTEDGVNYHLRRLQAAGLLRREGGRSAGQWVVVQRGKGEHEFSK